MREALDLALEALKNGKRVRHAEGGTKYQPELEDKAITACEQALAAPVLEPPPWWPAVENILKEYGLQAIDFVADFNKALAAQPAPVQPVAWQHRKPICDSQGKTLGHSDWKDGKGLDWWPHRALYTTPPAAQRQCNWPTCQTEEYQQSLAEQIKQELVTGAAPPAVPDEITDRSESPEYIQGWNDCRALMLEMRKP